jgi:hypothetical protein
VRESSETQAFFYTYRIELTQSLGNPYETSPEFKTLAGSFDKSNCYLEIPGFAQKAINFATTWQIASTLTVSYSR